MTRPEKKSRRSVRNIPVQTRRPRRFTATPGKDLRDKFRAHIEKTGSPETFPGICLDGIGKDDQFEKLMDFEIDPLKRPESDWAYCPICKQHKKYIRGMLVYFLDRGVISAIGNECAKKENRDLAQSLYIKRQADEVATTFLLENLPLIKGALEIGAIFENVAYAVKYVHSDLHSKAPTLIRRLSTARQNEWRLVSSTVVSSDLVAAGVTGLKGKGSGQQTTDRILGKLSGTIALSDTYSLHDDVIKIQKILGTIQPKCSDEEIPAFVQNLTPKGKLALMRKLRDVIDDSLRFSKELNEFNDFFSDKNIKLINRWGGQELWPIRAKRTVNGCRTIIEISGQDTARLEFFGKTQADVLLWPWEELHSPTTAIHLSSSSHAEIK